MPLLPLQGRNARPSNECPLTAARQAFRLHCGENNGTNFGHGASTTCVDNRFWTVSRVHPPACLRMKSTMRENAWIEFAE